MPKRKHSTADDISYRLTDWDARDWYHIDSANALVRCNRALRAKVWALSITDELQHGTPERHLGVRTTAHATMQAAHYVDAIDTEGLDPDKGLEGHANLAELLQLAGLEVD